MSAYITLMTPMIDQECVLEALAEVGFEASKVEVHASPVSLVGYEGVGRHQVANIVIRRKHVGSSSNDIGFLATPTGYQAIVSDFDRSRFGVDWLARVHERYQGRWVAKEARLVEAERHRVEEERRRLVEAQRVVVHERAKKLGYRVQETTEGDVIRMVLVKRTY